MSDFKKNIIRNNISIKAAMGVLNETATYSIPILFVENEHQQIEGSLTDGDIRRALLSHFDVKDPVSEIINRDFKFIKKNELDIKRVKEIIAFGIRFAPVIDDDFKILKILDLEHFKTVLPVDVIIMAGGKGERLLPLTKDTPKPLLPVGNKPILEHSIDRLRDFGIAEITICVRHLGNKIRDHFGDGQSKNIKVNYVEEEQALETFGAVSLVKNLSYDTVMVMNSDLLTNIDYSDFYLSFLNADADIAIATIPYHTDVPFAIFEITDGNIIKALKEKPRYTYYANAGMYLVKNKWVKKLAFNIPVKATDFVEEVINNGGKVISYPILGYWLDIGQIEDYKRAQEDIKHLNF
jgi:dTDP-glucose pyrophosphorylase